MDHFQLYSIFEEKWVKESHSVHLAQRQKMSNMVFYHRLFRQNLKRIFFNRPPDQVTMIQWKERCWRWSKCFDHLKWRADSLEKTLILRKCWQQKEQWWEEMRSLDSISDSKDSISGRLWEKVKYRESWCAAVQEVMKSQTRLSDWTTTASQFKKWAFQGRWLGTKISEE